MTDSHVIPRVVPIDPPAPPAGLSAEAEALWTGWHLDLADAGREPDARETAVLTEACRHLALAGRLESALAVTDDLVVLGSRGNVRVTPLVSEVDKVRRAVAAMLRTIAPAPDRSKINGANGVSGRR